MIQFSYLYTLKVKISDSFHLLFMYVTSKGSEDYVDVQACLSIYSDMCRILPHSHT